MFALAPFTLVPLVLYVLAAFFLYPEASVIADPGESAAHPFWGDTLVSVQLVSGQQWALSWGDALVVLALAFLLFALLRTASKRSMTVIGNMVMVVTLCIYIILFLAADFAGTSTFFLLTIIALVDTLATVSISMVASHSTVEAVPD